MTVKTIYISRHGYRSNWLPDGPYPPPPTGVDGDVPLAEHGIHQAQEFAHYIMSLPDTDKPELLFSSPFYRCIQTIYPTSELLEMDIIEERGLGEWFRQDRSVIPVPTSTAEMSKLFPNKSTKIVPEMWETVIPSEEGETEEMIRKRCFDFWPSFIKRVETEFPECEKILLCTHAATKAALGMTLLGFDNLQDSIDDNGSIIRSGACSIDKYELLFDGDTSDKFYEKNWVMTMNGNTQFLSEGEEMHWDFRNGFEAGSDADIANRRRQAELAEKAKLGLGEVDATDLNEIDDINKQNRDHLDNSDEFETEEVYVTINLPQTEFKSYNKIDLENITLQTSGLETDEPLVKIGDKLYKGNWNRLVGTEVVMDRGSANKKESTAESNNDNEKTGDEDEEQGTKDCSGDERDGIMDNHTKESKSLGTDSNEGDGKPEGTVVKIVEHELQLEEVTIR